MSGKATTSKVRTGGLPKGVIGDEERTFGRIKIVQEKVI